MQSGAPAGAWGTISILGGPYRLADPLGLELSELYLYFLHKPAMVHSWLKNDNESTRKMVKDLDSWEARVQGNGLQENSNQVRF